MQILDEVKSVYNSQMTQNNDFNEEKNYLQRHTLIKFIKDCT